MPAARLLSLQTRVPHKGCTHAQYSKIKLLQVEPLAPQPEPGALLEEYQALLLAEKDCIQVGARRR